MAQVWIFILWNFINFAQAVDLYQKPSFISAKLGETVTFHCTFAKKHSAESMVWYKQTGVQILNIAVQSPLMEVIISSEYNKSHLKLERTKTNISFSILHAAKDDGGLYFCGVVLMKTTEFSTGTFLAVTGNPKLTISVVQSPVLGRVPPGESVSLQCTVLSERRTAELRVLWFRTAAGDSHPEIIYTHHNSSHQCEISSSPHSCVYNFSKSVLSLSDTGTYYCAVATCGKILLGNGTTVDLTKTVSPAVIWLGAALGACVIVIFVQAILICKWRNCRPSSEKQSTATVRKINQDHDSVELSYAALRFNGRKTGRNHREKERPQDCVYSDIRCPTVTDQSLFD